MYFGPSETSGELSQFMPEVYLRVVLPKNLLAKLKKEKMLNRVLNNPKKLSFI